MNGLLKYQVLETVEAYQLHDSHWLLTNPLPMTKLYQLLPEYTFSLSDLWE